MNKSVKLYDLIKKLTFIFIIQALGQCRGFITKNLPSATLVKTTSTAAAARALLENPLDCAAICSRVCASLYDDLLVLYEGIQDITRRFHPFVLQNLFKCCRSSEFHPFLCHYSSRAGRTSAVADRDSTLSSPYSSNDQATSRCAH